jgi:spore germination cell wall hydrolase CwlJ-like protein
MKAILEAVFFLALTVYGEARGELPDGQRGVVKVLMNRADKANKPIKQVALRKAQFSMYDQGVPRSVNPEELYQVMPNVFVAVDEWVGGDRLDGADHYHTVDISPSWSRHPKMTYLQTIDHHKFYRWDG